ncbi:MAG: hypothetical protein E6J72_20250, partial [Deltaproteobacteria bacterium]
MSRDRERRRGEPLGDEGQRDGPARHSAGPDDALASRLPSRREGRRHDRDPEVPRQQLRGAVPAERYEASIERIREWTPRTRSLFLRAAGGARMPFRAGQFISLELPVGERPPLVRPYSIASDPDDELIEICVDLVPDGMGSAYLFSLAAGDRL